MRLLPRVVTVWLLALFLLALAACEMEDPSRTYLADIQRATPTPPAGPTVTTRAATALAGAATVVTPTPSVALKGMPLPTASPIPTATPTPGETPAFQHSLLVSKGGAGTGRVISSPDGIECGSSCSALFPAGTVVALTAVPGPGAVFTGWTGSCTGGGACEVAMDMNHAVSAIFTVDPTATASPAPQYVLAVSRDGDGSGTVSSTPLGIACGSTCTSFYPAGTTVTLSADPASGAVFSGWLGDCTGDGPCTLTMDVSHFVSAVFTPPPTPTPAPTVEPIPTRTPSPTSTSQELESLAVQKGGTGFGRVTSTPAGINCGGACTATFSKGTMVTLTATALPGSTFAGWLGDCMGQDVCVVTVDRYVSVAAIFNQD